MSIVSSVLAAVDTQKDLRRWVREIHTDQVGVQYPRIYLAGAVGDLNAAMLAYASILSDLINQAEIARNIASITTDGSLASVSFVYSTMAENRSALREAYRNSTRVEAIMIGDFLSGLTDNQLANLFNTNQAGVNSLRTNKLTPAATLASSIRASTGT